MLDNWTDRVFAKATLENKLAAKKVSDMTEFPRWEEIEGVQVPIFYASSAGSCPRQEWYELVLREKSVPDSVEGIMRMYDGEAHQASVVHWLKEMDHVVHSEEKSFRVTVRKKGKPFYRIRTRIDGIIQLSSAPEVPMILEVKGLADWSWRRLEKNPLDVIHPGYRAQATVYMHLSKIHETLFAIKNKNTSQVSFWKMSFSQAAWERIRDRWRMIVKHTVSREPPLRDYQDPETLWCKWCRYKHECWGEAAR